MVELLLFLKSMSTVQFWVVWR